MDWKTFMAGEQTKTNISKILFRNTAKWKLWWARGKNMTIAEKIRDTRYTSDKLHCILYGMTVGKFQVSDFPWIKLYLHNNAF